MASDTRSFSLLPPVSIRAESRVDRRRSRTFPRCSRKSAEYPETDANALMRHLHPRDVTKICRVSLGHYCVYACGADISRAGKERRNKWKLECRTGEVERGNRNVLLHDEELINVFQPPRVRVLVRVHPRRPGVEHKAKSSDGSRAENPYADRDGPYPYPHPCVYVCASFCATTVSLRGRRALSTT